jgi:HD-GYP domain-containing protein (c-di-GMP phosphodiesterase class II)
LTLSTTVNHREKGTSEEQRTVSRQKSHLQELGKSLVNQLSVALRIALIYDRENAVFLRQMENFYNLVFVLLEKEQAINLKSKEGYLFVNETRLKFSFDGYVSSKFIMETFKKLGFESLIIDAAVTLQELSEFVFVLTQDYGEEEGVFERLQNKMLSSELAHVRLEKFATDWDMGDEDSPEVQKKQAKRRFFKTISVAQEMVESAKTGRSINTTKSKRAIQFLIDQLIKNETNLMSLTAIKNFDEYTFAHSVNVCILSVSLGARLGLSKGKLSELGFAALFHDIGKVRLPLSILNKPGELDEEEWKEVRKHPVFGVKTLLSKRSIDRFSTRAMIVSFEHHLKIDLSGYPPLRFKKETSLCSRIVTIADVYDSMTSGRVYTKTPLMPDEALRRMLGEEGKTFDPLLLKVFINMLGIYPAGSVVIMDTGEVGVVMKANPLELSRPEVAIIADKSGKKEKIELADLTKIDEVTGKHNRTILKTIDPRQYDLDIARYIY